MGKDKKIDSGSATTILAPLAFHPKKLLLADPSAEIKLIHIWQFDLNKVFSGPATDLYVRHSNAKIVLIGESGLGLGLSGQPFVLTASTHGRNVWTFDNQEIELENGRRETRETLLWDLAGQPGYRVIHQLSLNDLAVALVVFDAGNEFNLFEGVHYWNRALQMAQRTQGDIARPFKKYLIAARIDRGGKSVSRARIDSLVQELGFDGYFETSAKEGWGIAELIRVLKKAIDWEMLPKVSSTELFQHIKAFLVTEKKANRLLSTVDDLYHLFLTSSAAPKETDGLRAQFETCIGRLESQGLIRRFSFGEFVLLKPELLDAYAAALINAVTDEQDGLGSISEEKVRQGEFPIPEDERIKDRELERFLRLAMVEDLLRYEIALLEHGDDGNYLVFPSQSTRENLDLIDPEGKALTFRFEGPISNIYATLAVRLSHSGLFTKKELWKNAVTYAKRGRGTYGLYLNMLGDGIGELTLFFDENTSNDGRSDFEEFVYRHLQRRAIPGSIRRQRIFTCKACGVTFPDQIIQMRRERNFDWLDCPVCSERISLREEDKERPVVLIQRVSDMNRSADNERSRAVSRSVIAGKIATKDFDVFLCHNTKDKPAVKQIGEQLKELGILPWLDEWELRPGLPWQRLLEQQIGQIKSAAVFVGKDGIGPWEQVESEALLRQFMKRTCPIIPVILATTVAEPQLPIFLEGMTWVDFRRREPDPMERLIWGITGKRDVYRKV